MDPRGTFLWGALGSFLPLASRFALSLPRDQPMPQITLTNAVVILVVMACGGLIAVAWKPEHPLKAIYIGIAWPFIVSALAHIIGP